MYTKYYTGHAYTEKVFIIYLELNLTGHPLFYLEPKCQTFTKSFTKTLESLLFPHPPGSSLGPHKSSLQLKIYPQNFLKIKDNKVIL